MSSTLKLSRAAVGYLASPEGAARGFSALRVESEVESEVEGESTAKATSKKYFLDDIELDPASARVLAVMFVRRMDPLDVVDFIVDLDFLDDFKYDAVNAVLDAMDVERGVESPTARVLSRKSAEFTC